MPDYTIEIAGEMLTLQPERTLYWAKAQTLFVADTHWGKDATFRAMSMAVPGGILRDDLARLDNAIVRSGATRLIILGDLLHAKKGIAPSVVQTVQAWREIHSGLEIVLVRGNHDLRAGDPPDSWGFTCVDAPLAISPFVLQHEPETFTHGAYTFAGHLHPAALLNGAGRQQIKLPCFWFRKHGAVLPAFGGFIDHAIIRPRQGERVYIPVDDEMLAFE